MKELTLKVEYLYGVDEEFELYMKDFNGIEEAKYDKDTLDVYIKYDDTKISLNRIKLEVFLFLGINTIPSLLAFDKHSKNKLEKATITIKDLCCEYCLMGMIEELLFIDGIDKVDSDFDYMNKKNVKFNIMYDENIISADKIKELEKNMNEY